MANTQYDSISDRVTRLHSRFHARRLPFPRVLAEFPDADDEALSIIVAADIEASREWDFPITYARYRSIPHLQEKPLTMAVIANAFLDTEDVLRGLESEETGEAGPEIEIPLDVPAPSRRPRFTRRRTRPVPRTSVPHPPGAGDLRLRMWAVALAGLVLGGVIGWWWGYRQGAATSVTSDTLVPPDGPRGDPDPS